MSVKYILQGVSIERKFVIYHLEIAVAWRLFKMSFG